MPEPTSHAPTEYLTAEQLAEGHELYRSLVTRLRGNLTARWRRAGSGPATTRIKELRDRVTASVRIATAPDADATELHRQWDEIAFLARRETEAPEEMTKRLTDLAALLRPHGPKGDELLHLDASGDGLYAAAPRGKHGTLLFIRPGEGEVYVPTEAVAVFRAALRGDAPLDEAAIRADQRTKTLREAADIVAAMVPALQREYPEEPTNSPWACGIQDAAAKLRHTADGGE